MSFNFSCFKNIKNSLKTTTKMYLFSSLQTNLFLSLSFLSFYFMTITKCYYKRQNMEITKCYHKIQKIHAKIRKFKRWVS